MEHASIAAFGRFAVELLSLGAPLALQEATHDALRDETYHARLCFGLASAYAGRSIGPGRMPLDGAVLAQDPAAIVGTAFLEACVGETCAAIEAAEAAARTRDPAVSAVLRRVAADELRHAELGWRFVKWALAEFGEDARAAVVRALARASAEREVGAPCEASSQPEVDVLACHGVLPAPLRAAVRAAAIRDVVMPCASALLGAEHAIAA
jgi:hypothetical protein